jgi:hypothetical protein
MTCLGMLGAAPSGSWPVQDTAYLTRGPIRLRPDVAQACAAEVPGTAEAEAAGERGARARTATCIGAAEDGEVGAGDAQRSAREDGGHEGERPADAAAVGAD